jgi:archaellum component FlaC
MSKKKNLHKEIEEGKAQLSEIETREHQQAQTIENLHCAVENISKQAAEVHQQLANQSRVVHQLESEKWILEREVEYLRHLATKQRAENVPF